MSVPDFFRSSLCRFRLLCRECRSSREFRVGLRGAYRIAESGNDWDCPHGVTLTSLPAPARPRAADKAERSRRLAVCETCEFSVALADDEPGCRLVTCRGTHQPGLPSARRFAALLVRGGCPHPDGDRWGWPAPQKLIQPL